MKSIKNIYLAAAIDLNKSKKRDMFEEMAGKLKPAVCFTPKSAFRNGNNGDDDCDEFIARINFNAIRNSDALVAYIDTSIPSFGVPMELLYASYFNIPIVAVVKGRHSIYLRLFTNAIIEYEDQLTYEFVNTIAKAHKYDIEIARRKKILVKDIFLKVDMSWDPTVSIPTVFGPKESRKIGNDLNDKWEDDK